MLSVICVANGATFPRNAPVAWKEEEVGVEALTRSVTSADTSVTFLVNAPKEMRILFATDAMPKVILLEIVPNAVPAVHLVTWPVNVKWRPKSSFLTFINCSPLSLF